MHAVVSVLKYARLGLGEGDDLRNGEVENDVVRWWRWMRK